MNYFIVENGQQAGPYSVDELLNHGLNSDTLVWAEGMSDWTPAWQVEELKSLIYNSQSSAATPPPISPSVQPANFQQSNSQQPNYQQSYQQPNYQPSYQQPAEEPRDKKTAKHTLLWIGLAIILFAAILLGVTCPDKKHHQEVIQENVANALTQTVSDALPLPKQLRQIGSAFGGSIVEGVVSPLLSQVLVYHNYVFFSTTTIEFGGSSHTTSVGLLGKVFTVGEASMVDALKENFNKSTDSKSDNDWLSSPSADDEQTDGATNNSADEDASSDNDASGEDEELMNDVKDVVKKHVKKQLDPNDEKGVGDIVDKVIDMI